jgi:hypothetical protein
LRPDGTFEYNGQGEVRKMYRADGKFPKRKFAELSRTIDAVGFFSMPQGPWCSGCDGEHAVIIVERGPESKRLYFAWYEGPKELMELGRAINKAANLKGLVGRYY